VNWGNWFSRKSSDAKQVINWQKASIHLPAFPLEMEGKTDIFYVSFFYQNIHSQSFGRGNEENNHYNGYQRLVEPGFHKLNLT
jgi:hypothetical protein